MSHLGQISENVALRWLKAQGLKVLAKNYASRAGKIDFVMLDGDILCFIQVKYLGQQEFDNTDDTFPAQEQKKISHCASSFVRQQSQYQNHLRRFDALIVKPGIETEYDINWMKNIFSADNQ